MPWSKDRAPAKGELEFHLPNEPQSKHDEEWLRHRAERLAKRHHR